jgi:hypothetical protein
MLAASVPPSSRLRTALTMTVIGWLLGTGCIQPGNDWPGT